MLKELWHSETI